MRPLRTFVGLFLKAKSVYLLRELSHQRMGSLALEGRPGKETLAQLSYETHWERAVGNLNVEGFMISIGECNIQGYGKLWRAKRVALKLRVWFILNCTTRILENYKSSNSNIIRSHTRRVSRTLFGQYIFVPIKLMLKPTIKGNLVNDYIPSSKTWD